MLASMLQHWLYSVHPLLGFWKQAPQWTRAPSNGYKCGGFDDSCCELGSRWRLWPHIHGCLRWDHYHYWTQLQTYGKYCCSAVIFHFCSNDFDEFSSTAFGFRLSSVTMVGIVVVSSSAAKARHLVVPAGTCVQTKKLIPSSKAWI